MTHFAKPDAFSISLLMAGVLMFFLPLFRIAGAVAVVAAVLNYLTMIIVRAMASRRNGRPN
jgi:hypothetical protein